MTGVARVGRFPRRELMLATVFGACALFCGAARVAHAQPPQPSQPPQPPPPAAAPQAVASPRAEVLVLHGTNCATPRVDPAVGDVVPPSKHKCWAVKDMGLLALVQGTPATMRLPNGRTFKVEFNGLTPDKRYKVAASINKPNTTEFMPLAEFTADPGRKFHVGGFAHEGGSLVLAIKIIP